MALTRPCFIVLVLALTTAGCDRSDDRSTAPPDGAPRAATASSGAAQAGRGDGEVVLEPLPGEIHFGELRQLTFGGENAEAYFSFDESRLIFQSKHGDMGCDQIFVMSLDGSGRERVSSGQGRTTCSYFLPGDQRVLYASTHAADPGCLADPDRSHGYVWKLYDEFDIYTANADGSGVEPLIEGPGYDAEATVSPTGDKIVFTSTRDGDPEIYVADIDGSNQKRLTTSKGYDGGPFFSWDGTKIVYRANRPRGAEEIAKYDEIIEEGLVRPTRLEIFVMDADGKNRRQITNNGKANFGPFFHPDGKRVIFSSNMHDPQGRDFDLYIVNADGTQLQRVTHNETFDGFPMFTQDGKQLVFASNRHNAAVGDTNIFLATWMD